VGSAALLLAAVCLHAQDVPDGWKVVKEGQGKCQFAVPADWAPDKLAKSLMLSADGKSSAVANAVRTGQSFAEVTSLAKQTMRASKTIEDSGKRLWYTYQTNSSAEQGTTNWYVAVPGSPVCAGQISFKTAAMEETAKKIALSLAQAK